MSMKTLCVALSILCLSGCGSKDKDTADGGPDSGPDGGPNGGVVTVDESVVVFAPDELPSFYLALSAASITALEMDPFVYRPGTFRYVSGDASEEIIVENVGIRLKGRASFQPINDKPAFKVKFSEFVSGQRFKALRRLTLNNLSQDPSMVRERLGYLFFRDIGTPAPRCNHARVYLNGVFRGLYANVESLDESFLERNFNPPDGNLYDTTNDEYFVDMVPGNEHLFELESNQGTNDLSDLLNLIEVMDGPRETFVENAETVIDLDQFLLLGATQSIIADWDGYFGAANNYKIYHDVAADRFVLLPWGIDQTFNIIDRDYTMLDYAIDGSNSGRTNGLVFTKCKADETCNSRYLAKVAEALSTFEGLSLADELERILTQIEAARQEDTFRPYSDDDVDYSIERVREFIAQRGEIVKEQLER